MKTKLKELSNVISMNELCLSMYMRFIQIGFVSTSSKKSYCNNYGHVMQITSHVQGSCNTLGNIVVN